VRRTLISAALLGCIAPAALAADRSTIRIATEGAYAPWNFTSAGGRLEGFEIDLIADLCERMDARCEIVAQAWDGIVPALLDGRYDAIVAGMPITGERREVIDFSRAYATTPARFVAPKDGDLAGFSTAVERVDLAEISVEEQEAIEATIEALRGRTVGVQTATPHESFLREKLGDEIGVRTYDTPDDLDRDLEAGRVDVALADSGYWAPLLRSEEGQDLAMIGPAFSGGIFGEGVGVGLRKGEEELRSMFDDAIDAALGDGTIGALTEKWFGFDASATR